MNSMKEKAPGFVRVISLKLLKSLNLPFSNPFHLAAPYVGCVCVCVSLLQAVNACFV